MWKKEYNNENNQKLTLNLSKECVKEIFKYAVKNADIPVLKVSISLGVDIHTDNEYALRINARDGHLEVLKYLVEQAADIHACDEYALLESAENGYLEIVKYLVEQGAYVPVHLMVIGKC